MKATEQRIAIAEACGWTRLRSHPLSRWLSPHGGSWYDAPNYLNDLNAMHEAENVLNEIQGFIFSDHLFRILNSSEGVSEFMKIHATAAQRAEAFLKTLDLWKP